VSYLLESGQDPAQRDSRGRPAYLLASHKAVRDVFRRCALPACSLSPLAFLWTPQQAARYRLPAVTWLVVLEFLDMRPTCLRHINTACSAIGDLQSATWFLSTAIPTSNSKPCGRYMAAHPDAWDYTAAAIPSALTEEMEAHQEARAVRRLALIVLFCTVYNLPSDYISAAERGALLLLEHTARSFRKTASNPSKAERTGRRL